MRCPGNIDMPATAAATGSFRSNGPPSCAPSPTWMTSGMPRIRRSRFTTWPLNGKTGSDCDVGTPRDAGILRDSSPSGGNRSSAMTESQRAIIDAIRWCRRRRIAPTAQSVAEQLRTRSGEKGLETGATEGRPTEGKSTEGKGADAVPERGMHELVAHVLSQLGTMELTGLITVENGCISIVPGNRRETEIMMTILTRGGWYRRKHGALACVTPAIGIVPGRHAIHRHRHCRGPPAAG